MKVTLDDLDILALGARVLGSGGGGDPAYDLMLAKEQSALHGPVDLVPIDRIPADEWVLPIFCMGAPIVCMERLHSGEEFTLITRKMEEVLQCKVGGLLPTEIGGANALPPFYAAPSLGLPVVDADAMGRAFPSSCMATYELFNVRPGPGVVVDTATNAIGVADASTAAEMDRLLRGLTTAMGSDTAVCSHPLPQPVAKKVLLHGSVSYAIRLGHCMKDAIDRQDNPIDAILDTCGGRVIASGMITDIEHWIESSFHNGRATITGAEGTSVICFQNEFLIALKEGRQVPLATTPDIIVVFEVETGLPVAVERLQYGLRVDVIALPAPSIWTTPQGLRIVGPSAFGLDYDYIPVT